MIASYYSSRI